MVDFISTVEEAKAHARNWLFGSAAPLWASSGVLRDGMFAERINLDGTPAAHMDRRMRVQARQIYSFSTLGALGWDGPWREVVTKAVDILISKGLRSDGLFVHLFNDSGEMISEALDLYNHAFGLFALIHAGKVLERQDLLDAAKRIHQKMHSWHRSEGGYWEGELTPCPPYRQNPHMHMFEAGMAGFEATGDVYWQKVFEPLGDLFQSRFQDPQSGAVTEYFDKDWRPCDGLEGTIVEPGHCLEWAWLFEVAFRDGAGVATAERLVRFAREFGINHDLGVAINEVWLDGGLRDASARLWPQTERLKAAVARYNRLKTQAEAREIVLAYKGLWLYLDTNIPGTWRDRMNADGTWVEEASPASSFYHIVCALNELLSIR